jgi:hypothetical protein
MGKVAHCVKGHRSAEPETRVREPWCLGVPILSHLSRDSLVLKILAIGNASRCRGWGLGAKVIFCSGVGAW